MIKPILEKYNRIAVFGPPRSGKTTLAKQVNDRLVIHTDDFLSLPWEEQSNSVNQKCKDLKRYLLEGCMVCRCLRKGLEPDVVIFLTGTHEVLSQKQLSFHKGNYKIFNEWQQKTGVPIITH